MAQLKTLKLGKGSERFQAGRQTDRKEGRKDKGEGGKRGGEGC